MSIRQPLLFVRCLAMVLMLAVPLGAAAADAATRVWTFDVRLDDRPIGRHVYTLRGEGAERELTSTARYDVKILGITAYKYVHDATERWNGNCLTTLTASTDDDGKRESVKLSRDGGRTSVTTARGEESIEACAMTYAYWNPVFLKQPRLLNTQTGEYQAVKVSALGTETINVRGAPTPATRYRITGPKHAIEVWYTKDGEWVALESVVQGGRRLQYRLQ